MTPAPEKLIIVIGSTERDTERLPFRPGTRASVDEDGTVTPLPADHPVEYWVCCRVDEPWTWRLLSNQHTAPCARCGVELIYRVSEKVPTEPHVEKICLRCWNHLSESGASPSTR